MSDQVLKGESSLAEEIVQILRSRIINGEYSIGEKLVENKIAEELKVSRTPVREAFKQLTKEHLIEYVPNKGCFAKGFDKNDLHDIYAVRNAVERLAVEWAIRNKTEEDMADLKEQLSLMGQHLADGAVEKFVRAAEEMENVFYRMTGSRFIIQALKSYQEYIQLARQGMLTRSENLQEVLDEHRAICRAIEEEDVEKAKAAVSEHLRKAAKRAEARWL
ncbi:MAG: GntR family transcriptional regulator [Clostridia bacterium]|nr:GntR family transcriptional regulator [Clostridia bacterium]